MLVFILAFMITSCKQTPSTNIVQNKSSELIKELSKNQEYVENNIEATDIVNKLDNYPNHWVDEMNVKYLNSELIINANIVVPNVKKIPIYEILFDKIKQEQVDSFLHLYKDVEYTSFYKILTKTDYEEKILEMQHYLAVELPKKETKETKNRLREEIEQGIENMKEKMQKAPDNVDNFVKPQFSNEILSMYSEQESSGLNSEDTLPAEERISAKEYYDKTNTETIGVCWEFDNYPMELNVARSDVRSSNGFQYYIKDINRYNIKLAKIFESTKNINEFDITYIKARNLAEDAVKNRLGIEYLDIEHSAVRENDCYLSFFTRKIDGLYDNYCSNYV
jgi:hypothetical protein